MRSLVTGGAGFIGSHVAKHCLELGHEVIVLDDLSGGFEDHVPNRAIFIQGSVTDKRLIERIFNEYSIDSIYHLAAYAAEGLSHFIRRFNYETNLVGSVNLINAAIRHEIKCFVFTSSIAVYGSGQLPMREDMIPQPQDPYGISKYAVELDLISAHEMFGLNYVIFRPHNVFGEYQNIADRYRNVVGIFINQLVHHAPMSIFGDGSQTRAFSYIDDIAPIIANAVTQSTAYNQTFNIGADVPCTVLDLAHTVAHSMGCAPDIIYLPPRNEVQHAYASHDKVRKYFPNASITTPLEVGIARMVNWVKQNPLQRPTEFKHVEIDRNLPAVWRNT